MCIRDSLYTSHAYTVISVSLIYESGMGLHIISLSSLFKLNFMCTDVINHWSFHTETWLLLYVISFYFRVLETLDASVRANDCNLSIISTVFFVVFFEWLIRNWFASHVAHFPSLGILKKDLSAFIEISQIHIVWVLMEYHQVCWFSIFSCPKDISQFLQA